MKIAKQYVTILCVFLVSVCVARNESNDAVINQCALARALYERIYDIVDDNGMQTEVDQLAQKIAADEGIYVLLNLGKEEGYTIADLFEIVKRMAREEDQQEIVQVLDGAQQELSKSWFAKHPVMCVAIAAGGIIAYLKRDIVMHMLGSLLNKLGLRTVERDLAEEAARLEAERVAAELAAREQAARVAAEQEAQRLATERAAAEAERERLALEKAGKATGDSNTAVGDPASAEDKKPVEGQGASEKEVEGITSTETDVTDAHAEAAALALAKLTEHKADTDKPGKDKAHKPKKDKKHGKEKSEQEEAAKPEEQADGKETEKPAVTQSDPDKEMREMAEQAKIEQFEAKLKHNAHESGNAGTDPVAGKKKHKHSILGAVAKDAIKVAKPFVDAAVEFAKEEVKLGVANLFKGDVDGESLEEKRAKYQADREASENANPETESPEAPVPSLESDDDGEMPVLPAEKIAELAELAAQIERRSSQEKLVVPEVATEEKTEKAEAGNEQRSAAQDAFQDPNDFMG